MKIFITKVGRFFWSWGFLKFVLVVIALVILFYLEEDWRGAHAWAATKAKWEAKGETFNYAKFIPPLVPDEQNLAAIPLFELKEEEATLGGNILRLPKLEEALGVGHDDILDIPSTGNWMQGNAPDLKVISDALAENYDRRYKGQKLPPDILAQFDSLFPFTAEVRTAASTRNRFRFNVNYVFASPALRPLSAITRGIKLSQAVTLHADLALDRGQSDIALGDVKTSYVVLSGVQQDPSLIGGLVALAMSAINGGAIYHGLANHDWSDAQLAELEKTLRAIDFLQGFQFGMRVEAAEVGSDAKYLSNLPRSDFPQMAFEITSAEARLFPWPAGWWFDNASQLAEFHLQQTTLVDSKKHLVFPLQAEGMKTQTEKAAQRWTAYAPWNIWFTEAAKGQTQTLMKFAQGQVWIDQTRIACALERYRLAHGVYPNSLDALAPAYIDQMPHDIMSGQPYHYSLRADGTFLLYSIGWNQLDDSGKVVYETDNPKFLDYIQGDWVWPTPKY